MTFVTYLKKRITLLPWLILGGIIMTLLTCNQCQSSLQRFLTISSLTITCWMLMWFGNEFLHEFLDEKINWTKHPLKRLLVGLIIMMLYTVTTTYVVVSFSQKVFGLNIGAVSKTIYLSVGITFVISLLLTSRSFLFNWRQTAIDAEKFQKESTAAKFESLHSQVNPHFLFNSLNVLTNLVYEDQDKAAKFIKQLSEVYRYLLEMRDKEIVPLEEEKKFLKAYFFLQQIRFGEKLQLTISLEEVNCMIPPLVIQMLVENAIKHNEVSEENPLHIHIYTSDNFIVIENNLQKKSIIVDGSTGFGLDNICKRYAFLTDKKVEVMQDEKFTVKLPIINQI